MTKVEYCKKDRRKDRKKDRTKEQETEREIEATNKMLKITGNITNQSNSKVGMAELFSVDNFYFDVVYFQLLNKNALDQTKTDNIN
jgi:hypothetical protein